MATNPVHLSILGYRAGQCRNDPKAISHTYAETKNGMFPMCGYGWNRSGGESFSVFRGSYGTHGKCKVCRKNLDAGKPPVTEPFPHKTRWL